MEAIIVENTNWTKHNGRIIPIMSDEDFAKEEAKENRENRTSK